MILLDVVILHAQPMLISPSWESGTDMAATEFHAQRRGLLSVEAAAQSSG